MTEPKRAPKRGKKPATKPLGGHEKKFRKQFADKRGGMPVNPRGR